MSHGTNLCNWLAKMLDVCFDFSLRYDIMFNPVKSVCVTFKPKDSKLSCPRVRLDSNILEYISQTKYLGFMLTQMLKMMKICSDKCVHCIFDQTSYYALFIIVLLMLNWNCLKVTVPHFTVVIYGLHTKCQHLIGYVQLLTAHAIVFLVM